MLKCKYTYLLILLIFAIGFTDFEVLDKEISNTVTDDQSGEVLPGINILVKGTNQGTSIESGFYSKKRSIDS